MDFKILINYNSIGYGHEVPPGALLRTPRGVIMIPDIDSIEMYLTDSQVGVIVKISSQ